MNGAIKIQIPVQSLNKDSLSFTFVFSVGIWTGIFEQNSNNNFGEAFRFDNLHMKHTASNKNSSTGLFSVKITRFLTLSALSFDQDIFIHNHLPLQSVSKMYQAYFKT